MGFTLLHEDGQARSGILHTDRGDIDTPVFMPVGTQGAVKAVEHRELVELEARIILGNSYHLYLRPGAALVEQAGGLHRFINWQHALLTDSGGYQVFSLQSLRAISEEGVEFKSHHDGSLHRFTPENVVDLQRSLGSDVMMVLDECTPHPCDAQYAEESHERTLRWAARAAERFAGTQPLYNAAQMHFGIVQGSVFPRLREASARGLVQMNFDGYAIGGLSVGEPPDVMAAMTGVCTALLPREKPRYLMGVGTPEDILEAIARGVDMFDCVLPTRNGRNGMFFTRHGRVNIRNASHTDDLTPVDPECGCYGCRTYSRAYVRHLFRCGEILGLQVASMHNLYFYLWFMAEARRAIAEKRFASWKTEISASLATVVTGGTDAQHP